MMSECTFCKIINKQLPAQILYESESVMAFPDINPAADTHILVVPKEHIPDMQTIKDRAEILMSIYNVIGQFVDQFRLNDSSYRVLVNGGKAQHVPHVHFHLLGGTWRKQV